MIKLKDLLREVAEGGKGSGRKKKKGDKKWKEIKSKKSVTYEWDNSSTYVKKPPFFNNINNFKINNVSNARILSIFGDSVTTDHISPAGSIPHNSSAGNYLIKQNVDYLDFNYLTLQESGKLELVPENTEIIDIFYKNNEVGKKKEIIVRLSMLE